MNGVLMRSTKMVMHPAHYIHYKIIEGKIETSIKLHKTVRVVANAKFTVAETRTTCIFYIDNRNYISLVYIIICYVRGKD